MLMVGVPIQMYALTSSSFLVGLVAAVEGGAAIIGMIIGGVLADRYDRRTLILFARAVSGVTFVGLAINAMLAQPSVIAIFVLAFINGLIGSISVAALLAVIPALIPQEQLVGAGALNVLSARAGAVVSPALGGVVIAAASVSWNYWIAAIGTAITIALLAGLPSLPPPKHDDVAHGDAPEFAGANNSVLSFLVESRVVGGAMATGIIAMLGGGVLVLVPGLADQRFGGDSRAAGLLYAAVAVGAVAATVTSGWLERSRRPGVVLLAAMAAGFVAQALAGAFAAIVIVFVVMVAAGALSSVQEVLRFSLIQIHTPARMLGRVNGLWSAQQAGGLAVGAVIAGAFGSIFSAADAIMYYSLSAGVLALIAVVVLGSLRGVSGETTPFEVDGVPAQFEDSAELAER